jgi:hypothetical protein
MPFTDTVARVVDRLTQDGYPAQFRAEDDGLHVVGGAVFAPEDVVVEKMARFEGVSDPDDECVVFALRAPDGTRGTWAATYGPEGRDEIEQEALRLLSMKASPDME